MSRATVSKSRADKGKDKDKDRGGSTSVPMPSTNTDVIPGRFTETDWSSMLEKEEGEEFSVDIVGDVVNAALEIIYENYIQTQLYPYTVSQAREAILQIIEWQFLARDEGETNPEENFTWQEEDEPQPSIPDAWAQGSVPRQPQPALSPPVSEPDTDVTSVSRMSEPEILEDLPTTINETGTIAEAVETYAPVSRPDEITEGETEEEQKKNEAPSKSFDAKPRKFKYKPYRGLLKSAGLRNILKTLDETDKDLELAEQRARDPSQEQQDVFEHMPLSCHSILKVQAGRPPGSKDVTYDEKGNVVSIIRLDPNRLPSHRVRTKFAIVDPAVEAAHARLIAMRTGRFISSTNKTAKTNDYAAKSSSCNEPSDSVGNGLSSKRGGPIVASATTRGSISNSMTAQMKAAFESNAVSGGITPLPPPLIESMDLSPGVVVKEGNRIKRGPQLQLRHGEAVTSAKLRSLRSISDGRDGRHTRPQLTVEQILLTHSPILRPLHATEPIPPILPRPSNSAQESMV